MNDIRVHVGTDADIFAPTAAPTDAAHATNIAPKEGASPTLAPQPKNHPPEPVPQPPHSPAVVIERSDGQSPLISGKTSETRRPPTERISSPLPEPDPVVDARRLLDGFTPHKKLNSVFRSETAQLDEFVDFVQASRDIQAFRQETKIDIRKMPQSLWNEIRRFHLGRQAPAAGSRNQKETSGSIGGKNHSTMFGYKPAFEALREMLLQKGLLDRFNEVRAHRDAIVAVAQKRVDELQQNQQHVARMRTIGQILSRHGISPKALIDHMLWDKK